MTSDVIRSFNEDLGMNTLLIVLVLVTYLTTFASGRVDFTTGEGLIFTACGILYIFLGIVTLPQYKKRGGAAIYAHQAVQTVLSALIYYLSQGQGWLIMLPVLGQSVILLPPKGRATMLLLNLLCVMFVTVLLVDPMISTDSRLSLGIAILLSGLQYALSALFVVLFTLVAVREREARAAVEELAEELEAANAQLRTYTTQAEELAMVKERNRLAREIHDGLGHYLTAINMQIQAGLAVLDHNRERGLNALKQAQTLTQEGLTEIRRSVAALRASPLDTASLSEAIVTLADACRESGLSTTYEVDGEPYPLDSKAALVIYRAVQEGLTNARKHADAHWIHVRLTYGDNCVTLNVEDDGVGTEDPRDGFGLLGIQERVKLVNGRMHVESAHGEGFKLEVEVPTS